MINVRIYEVLLLYNRCKNDVFFKMPMVFSEVCDLLSNSKQIDINERTVLSVQLAQGCEITLSQESTCDIYRKVRIP